MAVATLAEILAGGSREHRVLYSPRRTSFIVLAAMEAFNSQWVENGTLYAAPSHAVLAQIGTWQWHIDRADWTNDDAVTLHLRRYPGDAPGLVLHVDITARRARTEAGDESIPLEELSGWLELWYQMHRTHR